MAWFRSWWGERRALEPPINGGVWCPFGLRVYKTDFLRGVASEKSNQSSADNYDYRVTTYAGWLSAAT